MKITTGQLRQIIREEIRKAKLTEQRQTLNEDIDPATLVVLMQAGVAIGGALGVLAGKKLSAAGYMNPADGRSVIQKVKDWWKSRKDTAAIEGIVKRLNKDPEVVEFAKSKATTGWKELLKKKLTGNEVQYINKVYRTYVKGED